MGMLAGRDRELAELRQALAAATSGAPRVAIVQGEPGIGKTALVDEFVRAATVCRVVAVLCDRFEQDVEFGVVGMVLGEPPEPSESPVAVGTRLLRQLGELQRDEATVLLILDDIQWIDAQSLAALRFALRRLGEDRICTVLARRPPTGLDPLSSLLADRRRTTVLHLESLSTDELITLIRADRSWDLSIADARRVVAHTGGVPLLLQTFLHGVRERAELADKTLPVPSSSIEAVRRILDTLERDPRALLQAMAVLEQSADLITVAVIAEVEDPTRALMGVLPTGLVVADGSVPPSVRFAHGLLRDAVYDGIDPPTRRMLHGRAAERTTGGRRLSHEVAAIDRPDRALADRLVAAAMAEEQVGHETVAATRLLQARAASGDPASRDALLLRALVCRVRGGDLQAAEQLRVPAERSPRSALRSYALGLLERDSGRITEARTLLEEALTAAERDRDTAVAARAALDLAGLHAMLNNGAATVDAARRALDADDPAVSKAARWHHAFGLWTIGRLTDALAELQSVPDAGTAGPADADALATRGVITYFAGDLAQSEHDLSGAIQLRSSSRRAIMLGRAHVQRSIVRFARGDWDGASADAASARALADEGDRPWEAPLAHAVSVNVPAARGDWALAEEHLAIARAANERIRSMQAAALVASATALVGAAREDFEAVLVAIAPLLNAAQLDARVAMRATGWLFAAAIQANARLGRVSEATSLLASYGAALEIAPQGPGPARVGWLRGMIFEARGDLGGAREAYAADRADPALAGAPLERALLLYTFGCLERRAGNRRAAIELLRTARHVLAALRATPYLNRVDLELNACGLNPTRQDPLALTGREQEVASLVARGLTNPEAAAQLFLTPKTIEYHLGNIYAKLGISSRRALRTKFALTTS